MRLAISNIAWDISEDVLIAKLLQRFRLDAIDVAPGKYFPKPASATIGQIAGVKGWWADRGIEITGMQALLFGTTDLNVFAQLDRQVAMLRHLTAVCRIAEGLGAGRLVFGSPKNRDRGELGDQEALDVAVPFFRRVGDIAQSYGVVICLEPNPARYGANFMTSSAETTMVVKEVSHSAIRAQLDTGAITINGEDVDEVLSAGAPLIGHIHASEPDLLPLGDGGTDHEKMSQALRHHLPNHVVSIEMLATKNEPHEVSIMRALNVATRQYRSSSVGQNA